LGASVAIVHAVSGLAGTASVFSTDVANGIGRLAEIISHRCAQAHDPLIPISTMF